jgi:2-hydroxymuconate-semialdehyde hydrolase
VDGAVLEMRVSQEPEERFQPLNTLNCALPDVFRRAAWGRRWRTHDEAGDEIFRLPVAGNRSCFRAVVYHRVSGSLFHTNPWSVALDCIVSRPDLMRDTVVFVQPEKGMAGLLSRQATRTIGRVVSDTNARDAFVAQWRARLKTTGTGESFIARLDQGSGHPVLMLHGIPTHAFLWRDVADVVSIGNRVIAPDLSGFGFSGKPQQGDLSPHGQADEIERLVTSLEIGQFSLVGHDFGALVACELVGRMPDRIDRLVLTNTSLRIEDWASRSPLNPLTVLSIPVAGEAALRLSNAHVLKQAFALFVNERERLNPETMALYWEPFRIGFDQTLLRLARENRLDADTFHGWKAALYDYKGRSLVVWGANDPAFKPDRAHEIVRLLGDCRYELFVHSNHFIQEDRPKALGRLISAFVNGKLDE